MKKFILLLLVGGSLFSCTTSIDKKSSENLGIAKRYLEAVENKNVAAMDSLLADNYMGYGPSVDDSTNKAEALANWKDNADNLYESIKYTRYQNIAITVTEKDEAEPGDWVSNWAYLTLKYKNGSGPVHIWVNAVYRIENGKIVYSRTFYNEADVLHQLGYTNVVPVTKE
jgi:hypothetical protein